MNSVKIKENSSDNTRSSIKSLISSFKNFKNLPKKQKNNLVVLMILLISIPLSITAAINPTIFWSDAYEYPLTPPISDPTGAACGEKCIEQQGVFCQSGLICDYTKTNLEAYGICVVPECYGLRCSCGIDQSPVPTPSIYPSPTPTSVPSPTPTPTPTSTPSPTPATGAFDILNPISPYNVSCNLYDDYCIYEPFIASNRIQEPLYDTTIAVLLGESYLEIQGFDGSWTNTQTVSPIVYYPNNGPNQLFRFKNPKNIGTYYGKLLIDGKTCNNNVTPPDCYFYGGKVLTITVNVTNQSPSPTPTSVPSPTPTPTPTAIPSPIYSQNPSPVPSAVPSPTPGEFSSKPEITTSKFSNARIGRSYSSSAVAIDRDRNDILTMQIFDLPPGIVPGNCQAKTSWRGTRLSCEIYGTPTTAGNYDVIVSIKDLAGNVQTKFIPLNVSGTNRNLLQRFQDFFIDIFSI